MDRTGHQRRSNRASQPAFWARLLAVFGDTNTEDSGIELELWTRPGSERERSGAPASR